MMWVAPAVVAAPWPKHLHLPSRACLCPVPSLNYATSAMAAARRGVIGASRLNAGSSKDE